MDDEIKALPKGEKIVREIPGADKKSSAKASVPSSVLTKPEKA